MSPGSFQNYHVSAVEDQQTLTAALRLFLVGQSWGEVQHLVRKRHVQVNGNLCLDEARRLATGDVVKVWTHPLAKPVEEDDVRIVYLDAHVVVVEKPAGVTTLRHNEERTWSPQRKQAQPTLDEIVARILAKRYRSGGRTGRRSPGVRAVHRLDRDTSGLMVFARTVPAERLLVQQFAKHTILRKYLAVVHGDCQAETIALPLVRDRGDGLRGCTPGAGDGQRAVTHVKPLERLGAYTVVECTLETGRTHQIRIHLSERGHVVCGDKVYGKPLRSKPLEDTSGAPRQALHAAELGFQHPLTGEQLFFRMRLPEDLQEFLTRLRQECGHSRRQDAAAEADPVSDIAPPRQTSPGRQPPASRKTEQRKRRGRSG